MTRDAASGAALIVGAVAGVVTMSLHPSGRDLAAAVGHSSGPAHLNLFVHALAIASLPVLFFGAIGLTRRLATEPGPGLATGALVTYALAAVAVLCAAVANGLVAPDLIERMTTADAAQRPAFEALLHYNWRLNQAFAGVFVVASSVAIALWSAAILAGRALPRGLGTAGCIVAALVLVAFLSGHLRLHVHGFGLVVFAQAAWLVAVGAYLRRPTAPPVGQPPAPAGD